MQQSQIQQSETPKEGKNGELYGKYKELEKNFIQAQQKIGDALTIVQNIRIKKDDKDRIMNCLCEQ